MLLTHGGYGHQGFQDRSACIEAARVRYLVDLETPPPGTVCPPARPRIVEGLLRLAPMGFSPLDLHFSEVPSYIGLTRKNKEGEPCSDPTTATS